VRIGPVADLPVSRLGTIGGTVRALRLVSAFAPLALVGVALSGCGAISPSAASVNQTVISRASLDRELNDIHQNPRYVQVLQSQGGQLSGNGPGTFTQAFVASTLNQQLRYALVHDELVRRHAVPDAQAVSAAEQQVPQEFSDQQGSFFNQFPASYRTTLAQRQADVMALEKALGTDQADQQYYDAHQGEFATEVCVRHILLAQKDAAGSVDFAASKTQAAKVKAELDAGGDFATLARSVSQDNQPGGSASDGGKLTGSAADGCLTANDLNQLVSPFVQAVSELPVNQVSAPVQTQFGYHLIEVTSRQVPPYGPDLQSTAAQGVFIDFLRGALQKATIKVNPQFGTVDRGNPANGDVPTVVPPSGPALPASPSTTAAAPSAQ
jgi:parvulin-like peptidyl-prolyl isomerase